MASDETLVLEKISLKDSVEISKKGRIKNG